MELEIILHLTFHLSADYWSLGILIFEFLVACTTFNSLDTFQTLRIINKESKNKISFPFDLTPNAKKLILDLCKKNPTERLGYQNGGFDLKK